MIAILGDIHANLEALEAVLLDIREQGIEQWISLGDVIGYGANPRECLDRARGAMVTLMGDHEKALLFEESDLSERSLRILQWTFGQIFSHEYPKEANRNLWMALERMASTEEFRSEEGVLFVHGSPTDVTQGVLHPRDVEDPEILEPEFARVENICFCGHTHLPGVFTEGEGYRGAVGDEMVFPYTGKKMIVNVGSVGCPKDTDHRAGYVVYDGQRTFHRILGIQTVAEYWLELHLMRCQRCHIRLRAEEYRFGEIIECPNCREGPSTVDARALAVCDSPSDTLIGEAVGAGPRPQVRQFDEMIGESLSGYQVLSLLGESATSKVYKARQITLERIVALKMLQPETTLEAEQIQRFSQEAMTMARVSHPNVVILHDFFQVDGRFFLAMEYVEGVPLATLIRSEERLDPTRTLEIGFQVLLGLAAAHRVSIVHRDVNPNNIMVLVDSGVAKLMDFGISLSTDATRSGELDSIIGTASYMAPEQINGQRVDWRCDLYGVGASLYHCLSGAPPYEGLNILERQAAKGNLHPIADLAPGISPEVAALIGRLMDPDPARRHDTHEDAIAALDEILTGFSRTHEEIPIPDTPAPLPVTRPRRRPTSESTVIPGLTRRTRRLPCPHCGAKIRIGAKKCGSCRRDLR